MKKLIASNLDTRIDVLPEDPKTPECALAVRADAHRLPSLFQAKDVINVIAGFLDFEGRMALRLAYLKSTLIDRDLLLTQVVSYFLYLEGQLKSNRHGVINFSSENSEVAEKFWATVKMIMTREFVSLRGMKVLVQQALQSMLRAPSSQDSTVLDTQAQDISGNGSEAAVSIDISEAVHPELPDLASLQLSLDDDVILKIAIRLATNLKGLEFGPTDTLDDEFVAHVKRVMESGINWKLWERLRSTTWRLLKNKLPSRWTVGAATCALASDVLAVLFELASQCSGPSQPELVNVVQADSQGNLYLALMRQDRCPEGGAWDGIDPDVSKVLFIVFVTFGPVFTFGFFGYCLGGKKLKNYLR